ncbi:MAG: thiamine pyrophosphate-dependent enzyme [Thermomicrobiales bacterium]|nr:thiamine pyrophosphate-dependent enzyme [Thermomicrobiales bacterium]
MATTRNSKKQRSAAATNGDKPHVPQVSPEQLLELYRKMVLVRYFEEACQTAFRQGKVGGYLHVYIGQEAIATGLLATIQPDDRVITAYRDHAHVLLLGSDPKAVMAELYGKGTGLVKGKGGSMHLFDVEHKFWGGYGIVGGHIPLGVGMAYAQRYLPDNTGITQLYLGDGAIHNGAFHEGANLAGLWGREGLNPCLFVLENNQYGMGTSIERATANTDLISKFDSYAIPRESVDGMDIEAVYEAAVRLTERVRETGSPFALEAMTYRIAPHGAADFLEKYRSKDEVREARKRDPIGLTETKLLDRDIVSEDEITKIRQEYQQLAADAVKFAEESPEPPLEELLTDVYAEPEAVG